MIYIADDPTKDFINLNKKGSITVRIKKGRFADKKVIKKFLTQYAMEMLYKYPDGLRLHEIKKNAAINMRI